MAGPCAVAPDERVRVVGPAGHADGDGQAVGGDHVAAGDRDAVLFRQRLHAADERTRVRRIEPARQRERHMRLAGLGPHRREVGQRGGERLVADVGRRMRVEPEVGALG